MSAARKYLYLDTCAVLWLYDGKKDWLSPRAARLIEDSQVLVSPAVALELQYLAEAGRLRRRPDAILERLTDALDTRFCDLPYLTVIRAAAAESWTRDPFDRLIAAAATARDAPLLTADRRILDALARALT